MEFPLSVPPEVGWPVALALAWVAGELGFRHLRVPRISSYGVVGFALAHGQAGLLPPAAGGNMILLAHIAFGLVLFELGYRINLRWLRHNPWMGAASLAEALATFAAVYAAMALAGLSNVAALLVASLAMATSPAAMLRVVNDERASGQVTERALHHTAINCVLAVVAFKAVLGYSIFQYSGDALRAVWASFFVFVFSATLGALFGMVVPALLVRLQGAGRDVTLAFALSVIALVALTYSLGYSPVLAALVFGLTARHHRIVLSHAEQHFGVLGNLMTVLLFVFVAAMLDWRTVLAGAGAALLLVAVRGAAKAAVLAASARPSGIGWRKGALAGLALTPMSVFVLLLLEQARYGGAALVSELAVLAAAALLLEIAGPVATQAALGWAGETQRGREEA